MRYLHHILQRGPDGNPTAEWFQEHVGRCTASRAAEMMDYTKSKIEGARRRLYRWEKIAEILSGIAVTEHYVSWEMRQGIEKEPQARTWYEREEGVMIEPCGFVVGSDERLGFSPDGLVGDDGILEAKCPKPTTHLRWMSEGVIPEEHLPQCRFALLVAEDRAWVDFMSFAPELPRRYRSFTIRLPRENADIDGIRAAAEQFNADVDATIARINGIAPELPPDEIEREVVGEFGISAEDILAIDPAMKGLV